MKRCVICTGEYEPRRMGQKTCSPICERERKRQTSLLKSRKEAIKTRAEHIHETQKEVNAVRRLEELAKGEGCISCGRTQEEVNATDGWKPGGSWDAGHYLSVGSHPHLRFEPINIWLQCKSCNGGSGKYARKNHTVSKAYRENLIAKIGLEAVEKLEADQEPRKHTIDELMTIKAECKAKLKQLKEAA